MDLNVLRKKINTIDEKLIKLFLERMKVATLIGEYKLKNGLPVLDREREQQVINKAVEITDNPQLRPLVQNYMESIMSNSRRIQSQIIPDSITKENNIKFNNKNIGYCGQPGSYSEQAVCQYFGSSEESQNYHSFQAMVDALTQHEIEYAVLPIENSSTGSVAANIDLIRDYNVYITGEVVVKVKHCLLGVPGAVLSDIHEVYSHPQGFEQSSRFLSGYDWKLIPDRNTATSAKRISELKDKSKAAIASNLAAENFKLDIIADSIQDYENNYTRFVILSNKLETTEKSNKISVVLSVPHKPGALYETLQLFAEHNINLMKIESRPIIGKAWEYFFFFDFGGNLENPEVYETLKIIEKTCHSFKLLGNYENRLMEGY